MSADRSKSVTGGRLKFKVGGMDCAHCAETVAKGVRAVKGVSDTRVDFLSGLMTVDGDSVSSDQIKHAVKALGYGIEEAGEIRKSVILIADMDCPSEEKIVRDALKNFNSIERLDINLIKREVTISHSGQASELVDAIRKAGLKASLRDSAAKDQNLIPSWKIWSVVLSGVLVVIGALIARFGSSPLLAHGLILLGVIVGGWQIAYKGFLAAFRLRLDMNFLMSAAVTGAILIGQWSEAGVVIVLFALAQLLESLSMQRSRKAIRGLMDLSPRFATLIRDGHEERVAIDELKLGDLVLVRPGERIPVDGTIESGYSSVDQATITGESKLVPKSPEDAVYAGTMNAEGAIKIKANHAPGDTTLDRIIRLVEEAQAQRAPSQSFVDKFSTYYTPAVVGIAVILAILPPLAFGASWHEWIYRSLALLVIACPCALVISTPVTIVSALANAARNGVLIKGGIFLENFHKIKVMAFDKTGTITRGQPVVQDVIPLNSLTPAEVIGIAASVESHSGHPVARAILHYARENGGSVVEPIDFKSLPGRGCTANIDGRKIFLGNPPLFAEMGILTPQIQEHLSRIEDQSHTAILIGTSDSVLGAISLSDEIRDGAARSIKEISTLGVEQIALLTGDNSRTAGEIGRIVGISEIRPELFPQQKVETVRSLQQEYGDIAMVGDGVNDAPAMAAATVGIAMGAAGSDAALETADVALMADELGKIPWTMRLSQKAGKIIIQNICLSIIIKFIFVILASVGLATLWMAVFADMGVSLMVIFNGLRALSLSPAHQ